MEYDEQGIIIVCSSALGFRITSKLIIMKSKSIFFSYTISQ